MKGLTPYEENVVRVQQSVCIACGEISSVQMDDDCRR